MFEFIDLSEDGEISKDDFPPNKPTQLNGAAYLQKILKKYFNGEVEAFTVVAVLKDKNTKKRKLSLWVPNNLISYEEIPDTYRKVFRAMKSFEILDELESTFN
jgi:hypothetical protein